MSKYDRIIKMQQELNSRLASIFKEYKISKFILTSLGNSIASGYSFARITKPLLLRNESLEKIMFESGILLNTHHFARAHSNNENRINEWLVANIKESEIHKMNRSDYSGSKTSELTHGLDKQKIDEYYPIEMKDDKGLQDIILESDNDLTNIVIYNGCTGSLLDSITRGGKLSQKLTYGVKKDMIGLEAILKYIQASNRYNSSNTQVYICGVPNFLGLNISEIVNSKLKKVARQYSNVTYVDSIKSKFLYKSVMDENMDNLSSFQAFIKRNLPTFDIHYDELEYLKFNNNIIKSIANNYIINRAIINVDRQLFKFASDLELKNHDLIGDNKTIQDMVTNTIMNEYSQINDPGKKKEFIDKIYKYLIEQLAFDFHLIRKENIKNSIRRIA